MTFPSGGPCRGLEDVLVARDRAHSGLLLLVRRPLANWMKQSSIFRHPDTALATDALTTANNQRIGAAGGPAQFSR